MDVEGDAMLNLAHAYCLNHSKYIYCSFGMLLVLSAVSRIKPSDVMVSIVRLLCVSTIMTLCLLAILSLANITHIKYCYCLQHNIHGDSYCEHSRAK